MLNAVVAGRTIIYLKIAFMGVSGIDFFKCQQFFPMHSKIHYHACQKRRTNCDFKGHANYIY